MKLLLDTHAFLWFIMGDSRLSEPARAAIEAPRITELFHGIADGKSPDAPQ